MSVVNLDVQYVDLVPKSVPTAGYELQAAAAAQVVEESVNVHTPPVVVTLPLQ